MAKPLPKRAFRDAGKSKESTSTVDSAFKKLRSISNHLDLYLSFREEP
jgi:hypothetical protein